MKLIELTNNLFAKVDDEDYENLNNYNWFAGKSSKGGWYAHCNYEGKSYVQMHIFLLGRKKGFEIDHIDGDGLNNCKNNLRFVTRSTNVYNKPSRNKYGVAGISYEHNKWVVKIQKNYISENLGRFEDFESAVFARRAAEIKLYGFHPNVNLQKYKERNEDLSLRRRFKNKTYLCNHKYITVTKINNKLYYRVQLQKDGKNKQFVRKKLESALFARNNELLKRNIKIPD
jgi:hypothetical protein